MKTIDIYSTPQCGFCKTLKTKLDEKNISYVSHDVSVHPEKLEEMQKLTNGAMSVPVTILDKGTSNQKICIGYPESIQALALDVIEAEKDKKKEIATLTCPKCKQKQVGEIPTTACVPFYLCKGCKSIIKSKGDDCCVFCSYADKKCPLKKEENKCSEGVCNL